MITRYTKIYDGRIRDAQMVQCDDGEWVRWNDVKGLVEKQIAKPMEKIIGMERVAELYQAEACPTCKVVPHHYDDLYCANCGQRLGVE